MSTFSTTRRMKSLSASSLIRHRPPARRTEHQNRKALSRTQKKIQKETRTCTPLSFSTTPAFLWGSDQNFPGTIGKNIRKQEYLHVLKKSVQNLTSFGPPDLKYNEILWQKIWNLTFFQAQADIEYSYLAARRIHALLPCKIRKFKVKVSAVKVTLVVHRVLEVCLSNVAYGYARGFGSKNSALLGSVLDSVNVM